MTLFLYEYLHDKNQAFSVIRRSQKSEHHLSFFSFVLWNTAFVHGKKGNYILFDFLSGVGGIRDNMKHCAIRHTRHRLPLLLLYCGFSAVS
jgi:hypothetical protein